VDVVDTDPVRVTAAADVVDVTLLMADYNLMTVPVVDDDNHLLGVITVDDILEATIPEDWRRREPPAHPEYAHAESADEDSKPNSTSIEHSEPRG
jgi:Mg/Co/Ni transporter MgtE